MGQQANLVLATESGSNMTLVPVPHRSNVEGASWRGTMALVPIEGQLRHSVSWEQLKNGTYKGTVKTERPSMESVGSSAASGYVAAPAVAYTCVAITSLFAPARSTDADRADLWRMHMHACCGAGSSAQLGGNPTVITSNIMGGMMETNPVPFAVIRGISPI